MNSLKPFHTFGLNLNADKIETINNIEQLSLLIGKKLHRDFLFLGEGSNTVFVSDISLPVFINNLTGITVSEDRDHYLINVMAGENWHDFVKWTLDNGIFGFENLALIPGTVGASPIQNIGAYGIEVSTYIESVNYLELSSGLNRSISNAQCAFGYRDSIFKNALRDNAVITEVIFKVPKAWRPIIGYTGLSGLTKPTAKEIFNKVIEIRNSKLPDPKIIGNAGSFFKNPILSSDFVQTFSQKYPSCPIYQVEGGLKVAAGWLIDQCDLKGIGVGGVKVHTKQALVLTNSNSGTGADLIKTVAMVIAKVKDKFGIVLEPEVRAFGDEGEVNLLEVINE